ncbi:hypothetical protein nbrc107696_41350 [Gordonia spumicola]|uniref:Uncharacterized protein n=1 Tax=Gordonia spumicola TaxID=589161 RepID=A0A7I9VEA8_9ACTN|nr:hypothetical protein [Gordonia spumicola]GEE03689.1 hypothetical protein nbrc107696_41350 [Gordonia spumicola]
MIGVADDSALHRLRVHLDRSDDAYAHALWVGGDSSQPWAAAVAEARADLDAADDVLDADPVSLAATRARHSISEIVLAQNDALPTTPKYQDGGHSDVLLAMRDAVRSTATLPRMVREEIAHIFADRPRAILIRLAITIAMALSFVVTYEVIGWSNYDAKSLSIYLFSAVAGSVVCTNALCFDAQRVRQALAAQVPLWRVLIVKNIAIAVMIVAAAVPVVVLISTGTDHPNALVIVDQLIAMLFIWLGVANVLSVVSPLRREPFTDRLSDGTWLPFLLSFGISYGVGLTVNLMIYWRMWARHAAAHEIAGGAWSAFFLVLLSSMVVWILLTVLAVTSAHHPIVRRVLIREMR